MVFSSTRVKDAEYPEAVCMIPGHSSSQHPSLPLHTTATHKRGKKRKLTNNGAVLSEVDGVVAASADVVQIR
jgi:hypothetical protein